jgi:hypothetical protein
MDESEMAEGAWLPPPQEVREIIATAVRKDKKINFHEANFQISLS